MPNIEKVRELQSKVMKDIAAGAIIPTMMIGDKLGLFEISRRGTGFRRSGRSQKVNKCFK